LYTSTKDLYLENARVRFDNEMPSESNLNVHGLQVKAALSTIILVSNAFAWYFGTYYLIARYVNEIGLGEVETIAIWGVNSAAAAVSALLMSRRRLRLVNRQEFLMLWMLLGAVASAVPLAVRPALFSELILMALLWGFSFGLGMPFSMEYYTDNITLHNRGKIGGLTFLLSYSLTFLFGTVGGANLTALILCLTFWRVAGLMLFYALRLKAKTPYEETRSPSYSSILKERSFILYLLPWIMFSLINYLNIPILGAYASEFFKSGLAESSSLIEGLVIGFSALIGGFMCDSIGRKRLIIFGFVAVGLGYASLSVFPGLIISWYFYTLLDGVAWGMFSVTFLMALWGDLANEKPSRKYYALGGLPYLFANVLQVLIGKDLAIKPLAVFPLTSLFLFLAVLPLMYAPETLPEKELRERELKQYIGKAKKIKEKYT
jgi:MFS family permease